MPWPIESPLLLPSIVSLVKIGWWSLRLVVVVVVAPLPFPLIQLWASGSFYMWLSYCHTFHKYTIWSVNQSIKAYAIILYPALCKYVDLFVLLVS